MVRKILFIGFSVVVLATTSCAKKESLSTPMTPSDPFLETTTALATPGITAESIYPVKPRITDEITYPISTETLEEVTYPIEEKNENDGPKFTIDEPIIGTNRNVTGTGPAEVPIRLIDVTTMGTELATTTIDEDGIFEFVLTEDLPVGHVIGLQIGDLTNTEFNYDEFMYSSEYYDKPMIGIIFTIAVVK